MVWKILCGMPIEVFDEDDDTVWENETWELVKTRTEGDYKDSRAIGSANLITALNMVHQRLLVDGTVSDDITTLSHDIFNNILDKPDEYFSLEKLRIALDLDRRLRKIASDGKEVPTFAFTSDNENLIGLLKLN